VRTRCRQAFNRRPCESRKNARGFKFQTACPCFQTACQRDGNRRSPPPRSGGEGSGVGVLQQTRCQRSKPIDPPPPTSRASFARLGPRHARGRVEGGERTVHDFAISQHVFLLEVCSLVRLPLKRGRRECRALDAPASRVCNGSGRAHTRSSGHTGITRHSPRNGLRLISRSPRRPGFFATVARGVTSANLTPASGCQDHTTSPSAPKCPRQKHFSRPPHPAPRS
jgi:hypothetical protein